MSASHCFSSSQPAGWTIRLGRQNLQGNDPNKVSRTVARIILHPNCDRNTNNNDNALLRLSSPVTFTAYIRPVCLAASGSVFNSGTDSWVTGWGAFKEGVALPFPKTLQEVKVPVVGNRQCNCLNGVGRITDNMICAGVLAGGKDSCQGDSGGLSGSSLELSVLVSSVLGPICRESTPECPGTSPGSTPSSALMSQALSRSPPWGWMLTAATPVLVCRLLLLLLLLLLLQNQAQLQLKDPQHQVLNGDQDGPLLCQTHLASRRPL